MSSNSSLILQIACCIVLFAMSVVTDSVLVTSVPMESLCYGGVSDMYFRNQDE